MVYTVVLFLHILSVLGYVVGLGAVYVCLLGIRRAQSISALRLWAGAATRMTRTVVPISGAGVVFSGLYLYVVAWRTDGSWALVSLVAFFLAGLVSGAFQGRWIAMLDARAAGASQDAPLTEPLSSAAHDPRLVFTANGALAVVAGILFLMVDKPDLTFSLVVLGCALGVGLLLSAVLRRTGTHLPIRAETSVPS